MFLFKVIKKISAYYKKYELRCQNEILISSIVKSGGVVGQHVKFGRDVVISHTSSAIIGNNVHIGTNCFIRAGGGLTIGNNVIISRNIILYTVSHNYKGELLPFDNTSISKPVIIEDNVWIGTNVTIAPGTIIREGAIIGIGCSIYGEIPVRAIVGSNGNIIGYRDEDHYRNLKELKKFCKENGEEYKE